MQGTAARLEEGRAARPAGTDPAGRRYGDEVAPPPAAPPGTGLVGGNLTPAQQAMREYRLGQEHVEGWMGPLFDTAALEAEIGRTESDDAAPKSFEGESRRKFLKGGSRRSRAEENFEGGPRRSRAENF